MKLFAITISLLLTLSGCVSNKTSNVKVHAVKPEVTQSQDVKWSLMVGKWHGKQPTKDGGTKEWLVSRSPDGTYLIHFRIKAKNGLSSESKEVGHWGVSGPVYFSSFRGWVKGDTMKPSNPSDPYNYDAYEILVLNKDEFTYRHYATNSTHTVKRVPDDFELTK